MASWFRSGQREQHKICYRQPLEFLEEAQLRQLLDRNFISTEGCKGYYELKARAQRHNLTCLELYGNHAIEAKAREMLAVIARLDRKIAFRPGAELGLMLKQTREWALVQATPPKHSTKVRVGDVLSSVNGDSVLLETYEDMFQMVQRAKSSSVPYTLSFRRAPFHRGWLYKKSRHKSDSVLSGVTGWKLRYFVLAYGVFAYYDDEPRDGGKHKGYYKLESTNSSPTTVATAPAELMSAQDHVPGLLLEKGKDRLVLKSAAKHNDIHNWAALLFIAVAHANGGNDLLRQEERLRQARLAKQSAHHAGVAASTKKQQPQAPPQAKPPRPRDDDDDDVVIDASRDRLDADTYGQGEDDDQLNEALYELAQQPGSFDDGRPGMTV